MGNKSTKKISSLLLAILFLTPGLSSFAQGGYQQPVEPDEIYDQVLQGGSKPLPPSNGTGNRPLRGRVVVAPAGARFQAAVVSTLSSEINQIGDVVTASVSSPLIVGSDVVIPAGSQIIGQVVNVIPAARFMAGAGGQLEIRFTSIQTPDGQRYPLSASVDTTQFKLQAETGGSRLAKGVGKTAVGAGLGAALGTAVGAIAGGMPGRGAWSGAAIGGGLGAVGALAGKGSQLVIKGGTQVPILLDQQLQVVVPQR